MNALKLLLSGLLLAGCTTLQAENTAKDTEMTVYRSPTCSCCGKWIDHVKNNHFAVKDMVSSDMDTIKEKYGIPDKLASCHTAIVDGYVIEGHVPAADIQKLLQTKPKVVGLSAPGMPMGSPGMEMGGSQDYQVVSFDKDGKVQVFSEHKASQ